MIKVAICDDEKYINDQILNMLGAIAREKKIEMETFVFYDGLDLEKNISFGDHYDLIYLDIEMKMKNGIKAAKTIREMDKEVLIIYVSGYKEYVAEILEVGAFRFISKPIDEKIFEKYFNKAYERILNNLECFEFQYKREKFRRPIGNIVYFESIGRTINIVLSDGSKEKFNGKLNEIEKKLKESKIEFIRIHQSYLVSYQYIFSMTKSSIKLLNEDELKISEDRKKDVKKKFSHILGGEICD